MNITRFHMQWAYGIAYAHSVATAILVPLDVFSVAPWTRQLTDAVASVVPMINRVMAYGYPYPDKLRLCLASAWLLFPILVVILWKPSLGWALKDQIRGVARTILLAIPVASLLLFFIWFWPNFPSTRGGFLSNQYSQWDGRAAMFLSARSFAFWTPLWLVGAAGVAASLAAETLLVIRKIKGY